MGEGEGRRKSERRLQVASTLLPTRYMVPCTMQAVHGDAGLLWARMWVMCGSCVGTIIRSRFQHCSLRSVPYCLH